jgi:hypothetical protein
LPAARYGFNVNQTCPKTKCGMALSFGCSLDLRCLPLRVEGLIYGAMTVPTERDEVFASDIVLITRIAILPSCTSRQRSAEVMNGKGYSWLMAPFTGSLSKTPNTR